MTANQFQVCVVGAGPRGLSVLERICANARSRTDGRRITVHLVDPHRPGAGNVWRTDQSRHLLMNTVAGQVTLFTDDSVCAEGVIAPGPSLYEWARGLVPTGAFGEYDDQVMAEIRDLTPDSYPTRALYGQYLEWVLRRVLATAADAVSVHVHPMRAVRLDDEPDGRQCLALANGTRLSGLDAVVLAQGHLPSRPDAGQREFTEFAEQHGLTYLPPGNPADLDLSALLPGQPVLLRGLGLNFFDHLTLLTSGRGGLFERRDGRLVYRPSGQEPRLYAGSRRGVPHVSRGRNQKGAHGRHLPQVLVPAVLDRLRAAAAHGGLDFRAELWPLIAKEVEAVYYTALLARRGCTTTAEAFRTRYLPLPWGSPQEAELLAEFAVPPAAHWDWEAVARPDAGTTFRSPADFRDWLLDLLRDDCAQAAEGNVDGPVKAALDAMRDLRNEIRLLVDHGGLTGRSHRDDLDGWYTPLNAFLSIGPPAGRIEEMTALIEAGVLDVLGPGTRIVCDRENGGFRAESAVPGTLVRATALIEARLPEPDLRRTADPLLGHLLATGQCRPFSVADCELGRYETGGLDVAERPYRLLDAAGAAHPRRFAFGVPTEGVHWVTAAGARPGVDSVTLADSDAISLAVLAIGAADHALALSDPIGLTTPPLQGSY
ncbi:putative NAD(P)/FAD-binding protein YdhS [Kitasatospora sp. MAA4]|uniref:FAD/NAD(P)-binding protein n=1 Tax=Kitasatospora sp. MAA4 TaxID=3035093 RepID=UPI0024744C1C|nr:FAD/NAD(P)-binding protein [Kitasatospora sp. MAA4]MDH6134177.1 putative NAD(P)/FAD-binding protein YdhS [Kitasatospora sp. MAA4]